MNTTRPIICSHHSQLATSEMRGREVGENTIMSRPGGGVTSDQADGSSFNGVDLPESKSINAHRLPRALYAHAVRTSYPSHLVSHIDFDYPDSSLGKGREKEVGEII